MEDILYGRIGDVAQRFGPTYTMERAEKPGGEAGDVQIGVQKLRQLLQVGRNKYRK